MKMTSFSELTRQVHLINDLILADITYGNEEYEEESLNFSKHLLATKYWFARISFANKKRYVLSLLNDVKSAWTLSLLLKAMWNCRPKDAVLSINESNAWSSYDQVPMDHNRTAQPVKTLAQVMTNDRKWFHSLDPESQAMVLSELVTVAGGPLMWEVLRRGQALYQRYRDYQLRNLFECIVVNDHAPTDKVKKDPPPPLSKIKSQTSSVTQPTDPYSEPLRPPGHAQKQLETSLALWNTTIKSIRDSQKLEEVEMIFNDGTKRKIWKVNRPKPEGIETVDFVQLLPAVIGKRILSFLPRAQLNDYARVNKYWAFLVEEYRAELAARQKLDNDLEKLQELMVKHDTSMELLAQPGLSAAPDSAGTSMAPSGRLKSGQPSVRAGASERSAGGVSFRHFMNKLKPAMKNQRPIRNLAELSSRLERRGAADEHLWLWCENVIKQTRRRCKEKTEEGVLRFKDMHFPCPLMKRIVQVPLKYPLQKDPLAVTSTLPRLRRNISAGTLNMPKEQDAKRYHMWSRDFSSLYKVLKVASYDSPV